MDTYIGIKLVKAVPEARAGHEGYKVLYPDGYISWCPKEQFELANTEVPEVVGKQLVRHLRAMLSSLSRMFLDLQEDC